MTEKPFPGKTEIRAVILYHFRLDHTVRETHEQMVAAYGDWTPVERTISNWFKRFLAGNFSLEDEARPGRPPNPDVIEAVRSAVVDSKMSSVRQVSEATGVSIGTAFSILKESLGLRKFFWEVGPSPPDSKPKAGTGENLPGNA